MRGAAPRRGSPVRLADLPSARVLYLVTERGDVSALTASEYCALDGAAVARTRVTFDPRTASAWAAEARRMASGLIDEEYHQGPEQQGDR